MLYTNINEWKKHLMKKGEIKETFDGDFADADFLPAATDEFEELDTVETETITFEQFQDAILTEHEATCKGDDGEDTCQMLDEDQLKLVYDVFLKLTDTEESEESEDDDDDDDLEDEYEIEESKVNEMLKTSQDVKVSFNGEDLIIPKGTRVTNKTAMGVDPNYNFVDDFSWYKPELKGFARKMAIHDMEHRGINIDSQYVINESKDLKKKIIDTADRLLGIDDDWNIGDIREHLLWLIKNPEEIADGYDRSVFKVENIDDIMREVKKLKR